MLKIEKDLKSNKIEIIRLIAKVLIEDAKKDPLFAITLDKENKSLNEMWQYVWSEASKIKSKVTGGQGTLANSEIMFGWAKHYYDEDSIVMNKPKDSKSIKPEQKVEEVELPGEDLDDFDF